MRYSPLMKMESEFKEKYGEEAFHDYYEIAKLTIEELSEYMTLGFEIGRKTAL